MASVSFCKILFIISLLSIANSDNEYKRSHQTQEDHKTEKIRQRNEIKTNKDQKGTRPTKKPNIELHRPAQSSHSTASKNFERVSIEVQRLFNSFNTKRSDITGSDQSNGSNEDEMTVVIENDGDDGNDEELREERDSLPANTDQSGFTIVLDNTDTNNETLVTRNKASDFNKLSHSYEIMSKRFEKYLSEEKMHLPTRKNPFSVNPGTTKKQTDRTEALSVPNITENPKRSTLISGDISALAVMRNSSNGSKPRLSIADGVFDSAIRDDIEAKKGRSVIIKMSQNEKDEAQLEQKMEPISLQNEVHGERLQIQSDGKLQKQGHTSSSNGENVNDSFVSGNSSSNVVNVHEENENDAKQNKTSIKRQRQDDNLIIADDKIKKDSNNNTINQSSNSSPTHLEKPTRTIDGFTTTARIINRNRNGEDSQGEKMNVENRITARYGSSNTSKIDQKIVHPRKAQAMLEYLNKDPLESWIYKYTNLKELGLNSTMLRNGLVNAGSIDRLKNVMNKALKGEDITLSIIGGSISAGGGLYKDEESISGLYYKGLVDWWNKAITPLTGSQIKVNNIAIGSIGTDYFSFCLKSHISNDSNIVLWELSGNDYNRYLKQATKGAKPLERLIRMTLMLPRSPAILFINFFKGVDFKKSKKNCPNFEDQGEDIVAHYYKIPSLSWRAMVCEPLIENEELFTLRMLFSKDQNHPSLRAHAQMALLLILHLRHVMRSVLQWASTHDGYLPDFLTFYTMPSPLFLGLQYPTPLCWTLITPDFKESIYNTLDVKVLDQNGFKLEYATNFPIRFDRVICWKAETVGASMKIQFTIPDTLNEARTSREKLKKTKAEVVITTHTRFGGAAEVWLDVHPDNPIIVKEGREYDTGKRTQVDTVAKNVEPGVHTLNLKAAKQGFCLTSIMID